MSSLIVSSWLLLTIFFVTAKGDQVLAGIKKPNTPFTNETINKFIELVREKYHYNMIDVRSFSQPTKYPPIPNNTYDVQILYSHSNHYICIYFDPLHETVYVYDSYISSTKSIIMHEHNLIVQNRFPMSKTVYVIPKTEQYDDTSSGPLAIAYATTLILGENPAIYGFQMNTKHSDKAIHLREHIFKMLRKGELSLFPRSDRLDIDYISPAFNKIHPDILKEINTPNKRFTFRTINLFANLVTATTNFDMVPVMFADYPELYPVHNDTKNDVQILFAEGIETAGHVMCIFYDAANKTVVVYDDQELDDEQMMTILRRYPNYQYITYIHPKTKQRDSTSCGPFSIAYATSLILGHDPKTHKLSTTTLHCVSCFPQKFDDSKIFRKHILKMFKSKKLLPFPHD
ncbi:uncharacterized protein LOC116340830 isoform X2 [Contarinia nasturtii]|uniref:uncharacterized protein LOC116340830 isoform X2 n=1 Tax=Contarinia nasturtii TaxID=265458 RepID=UPI0012D3B102|nr:uncharacterized protein LOC116340830 isoform X2 [Contarinia nasturtii]